MQRQHCLHHSVLGCQLFQKRSRHKEGDRDGPESAKGTKSRSTDSVTMLGSFTSWVLSCLSFNLHVSLVPSRRAVLSLLVPWLCPPALAVSQCPLHAQQQLMSAMAFPPRLRQASGRQDPGALRGGDLALPHHLHGLSHEDKEAAPGRSLRLHQAAPEPDLTKLRFHGPAAAI